MKHVDVLISPRISGTNTPMKIYTYMASGKPIVASNIPAHDILKNSGIIGKQDILDYQRGINEALTNRGIIIAKKAKIKVNGEYSFNKLKEKVLMSYENITYN